LALLLKLLQHYSGAFYNSELYRHTLAREKGTGIAYLLILIVVLALGEIIEYQRQIQFWSAQKRPAITAQIPSLSFTAGRLQHDAPENPYLIRDPQNGKIIIAIDSTLRDWRQADSSVLITIGRDSMLVFNGREYQHSSLQLLEQFPMDAGKVDKWFAIVENWYIIFFFPMAIVAIAFYALLLASVGGLALYVGLRRKYRAKRFVDFYRLASLALIPMLVFSAISGLFGTIPWPLHKLDIPLFVAYILFAAYCNRLQPETKS
jgi:hypothetical protein